MIEPGGFGRSVGVRQGAQITVGHFPRVKPGAAVLLTSIEQSPTVRNELEQDVIVPDIRSQHDQT